MQTHAFRSMSLFAVLTFVVVSAPAGGTWTGILQTLWTEAAKAAGSEAGEQVMSYFKDKLNHWLKEDRNDSDAELEGGEVAKTDEGYARTWVLKGDVLTPTEIDELREFLASKDKRAQQIQVTNGGTSIVYGSQTMTNSKGSVQLQGKGNNVYIESQ